MKHPDLQRLVDRDAEHEDRPQRGRVGKKPFLLEETWTYNGKAYAGLAGKEPSVFIRRFEKKRDRDNALKAINKRGAQKFPGASEPYVTYSARVLDEEPK